MKALKGFIKPHQAPQRSVKIKILSLSPGSERDGLTCGKTLRKNLLTSSMSGKIFKVQILGFSVILKNRCKMLVNISDLWHTSTVQVLISSITKRTKWSSFEKMNYRFKLLSAEYFKQKSDNAENSGKIPTKIFLCLLPLGLKFENYVAKESHENTVLGVCHAGYFMRDNCYLSIPAQSCMCISNSHLNMF